MKTLASSNTVPGQADLPEQEHHSPGFSELSPIDAEIRNRMIAEAAYYRAEARGFATGYELEDWLEAEADVDHTLSPSALAPIQE